jgi:hypothetical protein
MKIFKTAAVFSVFVAILFVIQRSTDAAPPVYGTPSPLPLPSTLSVFDYEQRLFEFLNRREYQQLGWRRDKRVRDTGPYLNGKSYGTHPAVRIYYSPEIIEWLRDDKRRAIPDGAMIVKEQFEEPAVRHHEKDDDELFKSLTSWTVMVKDAAASHDGWFWSNPGKGQKPSNCYDYPFDHPVSGFGLYCVRCHASAKTTGDTNEYTFASLRNIEGFPGEPLLFRVDDSWREPHAPKEVTESATPDEKATEALAGLRGSGSLDGAHPRCTNTSHPELCMPVLNKDFLSLFSSIPTRPRNAVLHFPSVTHDWVVRRSADKQHDQPFVTSNQCMSCHAGLMAPFGPIMFFPTSETDGYEAPGVHLSPYGEWRWTPMGLAGRDPIFFAQLESELELLKREFADKPERGEQLSAELQQTCLTCHGVMGKRQFDIDHAGGGHFSVEHVMRASTDPGAAGRQDWRYGALARDGVSCTVCHRMTPREQPADDKRPYLEFFLETSITGNIHLGPNNELHGPFEDKEISPYSMEHALGFKPKHNPYVKSSQLCGTCHVVNLPMIDEPAGEEADSDPLVVSEQNPAFKEFHHHIEQATYLEWLNSEYENEFDPNNPKAKTCQDCHMSRDYHNQRLTMDMDRIETRMAAIQDNTYPEAESLAEHADLEVRRRTEGYARHNFRGLNVFLLEMFNQFDDVLGVRKFDFMTGSKQDIPHAVDDFMRQAREETATIEVEAKVSEAGELTAMVEVHNKVGHRFPSGVGFRRAFIELLVLEKPKDGAGEERLVWSSGRTNELGVLLGGEGKPLASEFFDENSADKRQAFQPHHEVITSPDEVQIYETLLRDAKGRFTTSFLRGSEVVKDNRLLPRGWKKTGPGSALKGEFLRATFPDPTALRDERYAHGSGSDLVTYQIDVPEGTDPQRLMVKATLYYQAIPPYFLKNLFETAPERPATQRLHYICSNIDLRGTPIEGWKLPVVSASASVK